MKPTNGRKPRTEKELRIMYRNGIVSNRPRTKSQMRWSHNDPAFNPEWDITHCEFWK